jgi:DNA-directed RNA polymerase subunit alpha
MLLYNNADKFGKKISAELSDRAKVCLDKPVAELELSVRAANVLEAAGVTTVGELVMLTESDMLKYRGFGRKALNEIKQILVGMDLRLGMKTDDFGKEDFEELSDRAKAYLDKPVAELELSVRSASVLEAAGITTVRKLVAHTEIDMLKYQNFGRKSLNELKRILAEMDLRFGMKLND